METTKRTERTEEIERRERAEPRGIQRRKGKDRIEIDFQKKALLEFPTIFSRLFTSLI